MLIVRQIERLSTYDQTIKFSVFHDRETKCLKTGYFPFSADCDSIGCEGHHFAKNVVFQFFFEEFFENFTGRSILEKHLDGEIAPWTILNEVSNSSSSVSNKIITNLNLFWRFNFLSFWFLKSSSLKGTVGWPCRRQFQRFIHRLIYSDYSGSNERSELIRLCQEYYQSNLHVLKQIDDFQKTYAPDRALSWYTPSSFLYRLLNKAVRNEPDFELILLLRFSVVDLVRALKKKSTDSSTSPSTLYQAQLLSTKDLDLWKKSVRELICIQTFLSTRLVQPDPLPRSSDEVESVLLKIDTGHLSRKSDPTNQTDILLMIESIFRLSAITQNGQGAWQVRLALCSDNGKEVSDPLALGFVLEEMGQHECAENFYQRLLPQLPKDHEDVPRCYHALGEVCQKQGQHENGIKWLKKTLEIDTANAKENAPDAAMSHHSLGIVHIRKGEYSAALKSLKKGMEIGKKSFGDVHLNLAMCYNNMGIAYQEQRKYIEA